MRCEDVREVLPAYVDGDPHALDDVDLHLLTCPDCGAELAEYRATLARLRDLRDAGARPDAAFVERLVAFAPGPTLAMRMLGSVQAHPVVYAVAGGAAVGATAAVAFMWRR